MGIFGRQKQRIFEVGSYIPVSPSLSRRRRRILRGADYLYIVVCILIGVGIFQRIEIGKLKQAAMATKVNVMGYEKLYPTPIIKLIEKQDPRVTRLTDFLKSKGSPLTPYAGLMVEQSDLHGIDYTLMASISGMESGFGKNTKLACHNPFGLGGTKPLCFSSWDEAIIFEASLLDRDYRINMANGIQSKYCPAFECNPEWSFTIVSFAKEIINGGSKD